MRRTHSALVEVGRGGHAHCANERGVGLRGVSASTRAARRDAAGARSRRTAGGDGASDGDRGEKGVGVVGRGPHPRCRGSPARLEGVRRGGRGRRGEVEAERDIVRRAAAITEYTKTSLFVPELAENGAEAPPEWFALNLKDGEDSAEMIDSSDEGEDEEDEEGE